MNWLTAIFSSKRIVQQAVELADDSIRGIGRWIDEQQLTDEERVQYRLKRLEMYEKFLARAVEESTARTVTRRVLAVSIIGVYLILLIAGAVLGLADPSIAKWLIEWTSALQFHLLTLGVASFYFGVHLLRK